MSSLMAGDASVEVSARGKKRSAEDAATTATPNEPAEATKSPEKKQKRSTVLDAIKSRDFMSILGGIESYAAESKRLEPVEITKDLDSGKYILVLERVTTSNAAKCRANRCLAKTSKEQYDEKIRAPYRINLQATASSDAHWSTLDKPDRRFYHVSCFEGIGVGMAKYLRREPEAVITPLPRLTMGFSTQYNLLPPAMDDWFASKGKIYDHELYDDTRYVEALKSYRDKWEHYLSERAMYALGSRPNQDNDVTPPVKPSLSDFFAEEPKETSLTDAILGTMGASHLIEYLSNPDHLGTRIKLLEVWGSLPESLSKAALSANMAADAAQEEEEGEQGEVAEEQVDSAAAVVGSIQDAKASTAEAHG